MNNIKNYKKLDILTIGFALFAMFFGAGNLIFPSYLGWQLGDHWIPGFLCYLVVDIGFSFVAMIVIARSGKGSESITEKLGPKLSPIFIGVICICIGPAIAIPRIESITYEIAVVPNVGNVNQWLFAGIFFAIVWALSISKTGVVDIIGKILSPLMVIALLIMIIKGTLWPIGEINVHSTMSKAVYSGITSGYQTMDMMAAVIFTITIIFAMNNKGYHEKNQHFTLILAGGLISSTLLFIVYGGLTHIGATFQSSDRLLGQVDVLTQVTGLIMGKSGLLLLGTIVTLACLTTAIGLITAISEFFEEKLHIPYGVLATGFTVISFILSNFGTDQIISMAAPILSVVYPVLIFLTFASIAGDKLPLLAYRTGAGTAFAASLVQQIEGISGTVFISHYLPMNTLGFGWVVPTVLGMIAGIVISKCYKSEAVSESSCLD